jgi:galactokinase
MIAPDLAIPQSGWTVYPSVVARRLARNFQGGLRGAEISFASDLPSAAGMSSSSALVVAIFAVLSEINRLSERTEYTSSIQNVFDLAAYLGCIENGESYGSLSGAGGVGTFGGSEDHTAMLTSETGYLKQYSFSPVRHECTVRVPRDCAFVIGVSGIVANKTGLAKDRYNQASLRVNEILRRWRAFTGLRADTLAEAARSSNDGPDQIRAAIRQGGGTDVQALIDRFEQFWLESEQIIPVAAAALARGDLAVFGELTAESQQAAETLLGNQVPETIRLVKSARMHGAYAASAFGAGFGGSVWALVACDVASDFLRCWQREHESLLPAVAGVPQFFVTGAGPALCTL